MAKAIALLLFTCILWTIFLVPSRAQSEFSPQNPVEGQESLQIPFLNLSVQEPQNGSETALALQLLFLLTVLTLSPAILILMTSFLRISIVLSFVQQSLGLQNIPPRQIILGISVFVTIFVMWPVLNQINTAAIQPLAEGKTTLEEAYPNFIDPLRVFMYTQMKEEPRNIQLFMRLANQVEPETLADVPTFVLIPAYVLHELTTAFKMGVLLFVPFVVIDIVVASITMSMGMIMLPPILISLPIKIGLFVLVDGWELLIQQLIMSYGVFR